MNRIAQLANVDIYGILSQSGCTEVEGVDDAEKFRGVQKALDTVGLTPDMQMQVMQCLDSALLYSVFVLFS